MIKIATLAAAAALLATSAQAQVVINTQNIDTPAGAQRFERDVRKAARSLCSAVRGVQVITCKEAVREEALSMLPVQQRMAYVQSREARNTEYAANSIDQA
ncbi:MULTISPECIES: UrcA family protein [unclassified Brevundimonas]|uniref:UrcA family protein n=1 Tax=unclassified Brevundimonas TaxID=2622653 RepID=UPI0025BB3F45|nr:MULTISPECIES: UrcA family protein [unclassified Brevundimonas]